MDKSLAEPNSSIKYQTNIKHQDATTLIRFAFECGEKGFTCDEWEIKSGKPHQTASARVFDLASSRIILLTKDKRATRSKRKAGDYRIDPEIGSEKEAYSLFLKWTAAAPRSRSRSEAIVLSGIKNYIESYRSAPDADQIALDKLKKIILKEMG